MLTKSTFLTLLFITGTLTQLNSPNQSGCKTDRFIDQDNGGCLECEANKFRYFFEGGTNENYFRCADCGTNCEQCVGKAKENSSEQEAGKCSVCKAGNGVDTAAESINCKACADSNCQDCNGNYQTCSACKTGFQMDTAGKCNSCSAADCAMCNTDGACVLCKSPKVLDGSSCGTICNEGATIYNGRCVSCPDNCKACDTSTQCQTCMAGYFTDPNGLCSACKPNCGSCYNNGQCTECLNGTTLLGDGTCGSEPWYSKWWVWLLLGLLLLGLLGAIAFALSRATTPKMLNSNDAQLQAMSPLNTSSYGYVPRAGVAVGQPILGRSQVSGRGYY